MDIRVSALIPVPVRIKAMTTGGRGFFWLPIIAVILQLTLSANVMSYLGYKGNVQPATFLILICTLLSIWRGLIPFGKLFRDSPGLSLFVFGIPIMTLYSIYFAGYSGSTVFVESFWSAGLLALLLEPATSARKRLLGSILLTLVIGNVLVALYESLFHVELFPLSFAAAAVDLPTSDSVDDFRAHAFYSHPLSASLVTSMAFFLLYNMRMRFIFSAMTFGLLLLGLLAFGGRTALVVTVVFSLGAATFLVLAGIVTRRLRLNLVLSVVSAAIIIPIMVAVVVTQTTMADRIVNNLYYDGSAAVRVTQWAIFDHLTTQNWLFGVSKDELAALKYQIGLGGKDTDIENFWILIFLDLGLIGFTIFATMFVGFLVHMARFTGTLNGWLLAVAALIIDSSSNSLGVWTSDLCIEVAFLLAISGFRNHVPRYAFRRFSKALPAVNLASGRARGLTLQPRPMRVPSLTRRVLTVS